VSTAGKTPGIQSPESWVLNSVSSEFCGPECGGNCVSRQQVASGAERNSTEQDWRAISSLEMAADDYIYLIFIALGFIFCVFVVAFCAASTFVCTRCGVVYIILYYICTPFYLNIETCLWVS